MSGMRRNGHTLHMADPLTINQQVYKLTWRENWLTGLTVQSKWRNSEKNLGQTNTRAFDPVWNEQKIIYVFLDFNAGRSDSPFRVRSVDKM